MTKTKILLIFLTLLLVVLPLTFGQMPPFQSSANSISPTLNIEFVAYEAYPIDRDIELYFHVFNSTGFITTNKTVKCGFHLYNNVGEHILKVNSTYDEPFDHEVEIDKNLIQNPGMYHWILGCNHTFADGQEGGFVASQFEISEDGFLTSGNGIVWFAIVLSYIAMIGFFGLVSVLFKSEKFQMLKGLFFLLFVTDTFLLSAFPFFMTVNLNNPSSVKFLAELILTINIILVFAFILFYGVHLIRKAIAEGIQKKEQEEEDG